MRFCDLAITSIILSFYWPGIFGIAPRASNNPVIDNNPARTVRYNGLVTDNKPFRLTESVKAAG